ncbi:hypothetical protein ATPR_0318 [Acetobacter tropicalis NBRC 101654]|uniref:Uncharacterized protein n=1 Tax=Acetobacter tropicalis NBRC 101654 TaxID=749388 RepID=F7VAB9_9PROT|nr:hypothetical protein ATPR_0318 [Acetobacter tropicalis NBRC 101654]
MLTSLAFFSSGSFPLHSATCRAVTLSAPPYQPTLRPLRHAV